MVCGAAHRGKGFLGPNSTAERRNKACNRKYKGCVGRVSFCGTGSRLSSNRLRRGSAGVYCKLQRARAARAVVFSQQRCGTVSSDPRAGGARGMFGYAFLSAIPKLYGHNSTHGAKPAILYTTRKRRGRKNRHGFPAHHDPPYETRAIIL